MYKDIVEVPLAFTENECQRITALGIDRGLEIGKYRLEISPEKRTSLVSFIYPDTSKLDGQHNWIFSRMWNTVSNFEDSHFWKNVGINRLNFLQFSQYDADHGGHFEKHEDDTHFYHPHNTNLIRRITVVIQLSDPSLYENGDLVLYPKDRQPKSAARERGSAIIFPSNMTHEVKRVTSGSRYSLVGWFESPKEK